MRKYLLISTLAASLSFAAAEVPSIGIVNFATCVTESKAGKKEQESMEMLRKQMTAAVEATEKELSEIASKFQDAEYLDSLSPKAEEELKARYEGLQQDMGRYQNQFYQLLNQANYQMMQRVSSSTMKAAEKVAEAKKLDYVINKEACFFANSQYDVTDFVVKEMDVAFELEEKANSVTDNQGQ